MASSAMCRGPMHPCMSDIAAIQLSVDGQLAALISLDGIVSLVAAHKLAAASGGGQL
jgi:hypothetical protein